MSTSEIILTVCIGLFTGFCSGLMGIGGSILSTPLLRVLLGINPLLALATPMPVVFPSAISGSIAYYREKKIDFKIVGWTLITAVPCTWFGASLTQYIDGRALMLLTATFLMIVGASFLVRSYFMKEATDADISTPINPSRALFTGAIGGFLAGVLAIGGGIVYVPAILRFFRRPMKVALATSLVAVMIVAIPGTIKHAMLGHIDWTIVAILSCSVIPASFFGAKLALRLRNATLERIFGISTILFGVYFLFSQL